MKTIFKYEMYLYDCCYTIIHADSHLVSNIKWFGVVCCLQPKFQEHFRDSQQHTMEVVRHNPLHQIKWRMNSQNWYTFVPHDLQTIETLQYSCMNISNLTLYIHCMSSQCSKLPLKSYCFSFNSCFFYCSMHITPDNIGG